MTAVPALRCAPAGTTGGWAPKPSRVWTSQARPSSSTPAGPVTGTPTLLEGHPFLTRAAAEWLRDNGAALVGIDSLNIDDIEDGARPVHTTLLGADIPIAEHLCGLEQLPESGFAFHAAPVKVRGMGTFPVRAYAVLGDIGPPVNLR